MREIREWTHWLAEIFTPQMFWNIFLAGLIFSIGIFLAKRASSAASKITTLDNQHRLLFTKLIYYGVAILAVAAALSQLGVDLKVILGAAGILTVAVGFAAQTSASNLISGIFLIIERPFVVGDIVNVGDIKGEVMAVDLLSTKIRTFNNVMVRVPNESMMKSNINNMTYFPLRRIEINVGVGYESDLVAVEKILREIAEANPLCLTDPKPVFLITAFADSSISVQLQAWTMVQNIPILQNDLYRQIKKDFDRLGISIPYPTRTMIPAPTTK